MQAIDKVFREEELRRAQRGALSVRETVATGFDDTRVDRRPFCRVHGWGRCPRGANCPFRNSEYTGANTWRNRQNTNGAETVNRMESGKFLMNILARSLINFILIMIFRY